MNVRHAVNKTHCGCTKVRASGKGVTSRCISQGDFDRTYLYSYSFVRHQAVATSEFVLFDNTWFEINLNLIQLV